MRLVIRDLKMSGHEVEVTLRTTRAVQAASVKFPGLLSEMGLSPQRGAKPMIRVVVDTQPPAGAILETRLVTRHFPITFRVHDLSSCMAGKIHAVLTRRYAKGRDLFDLAWYLTRPDRPSPNLELLANALAQTGWKGPAIGTGTWRKVLVERLAALDWPAVIADVEPFLEDTGDRRLLERDTVLRELGRSGP
jgi:hypothetical protein